MFSDTHTAINKYEVLVHWFRNKGYMQRVTRRMSLRTCKRSITLKITVLSHCLEVGNINLNCLVVLVTLFTLLVHGMQEEKGNVLKWRTKGVITQYQCLFARRNSLQNNQLMTHDVWTTCTDSRVDNMYWFTCGQHVLIHVWLPVRRRSYV